MNTATFSRCINVQRIDASRDVELLQTSSNLLGGLELNLIARKVKADLLKGKVMVSRRMMLAPRRNNIFACSVLAWAIAVYLGGEPLKRLVKEAADKRAAHDAAQLAGALAAEEDGDEEDEDLTDARAMVHLFPNMNQQLVPDFLARRTESYAPLANKCLRRLRVDPKVQYVSNTQRKLLHDIIHSMGGTALDATQLGGWPAATEGGGAGTTQATHYHMDRDYLRRIAALRASGLGNGLVTYDVPESPRVPWKTDPLNMTFRFPPLPPAEPERSFFAAGTIIKLALGVSAENFLGPNEERNYALRAQWVRRAMEDRKSEFLAAPPPAARLMMEGAGPLAAAAAGFLGGAPAAALGGGAALMMLGESVWGLPRAGASLALLAGTAVAAAVAPPMGVAGHALLATGSLLTTAFGGCLAYCASPPPPPPPRYTLRAPAEAR